MKKRILTAMAVSTFCSASATYAQDINNISKQHLRKAVPADYTQYVKSITRSWIQLGGKNRTMHEKSTEIAFYGFTCPENPDLYCVMGTGENATITVYPKKPETTSTPGKDADKTSLTHK